MNYRIDSDLIIIGDGGRISNGSLVINDNIISYLGEQEHAPVSENIIQAPVIMPGMWDCHGHYSGFKQPSVEQALTLKSQVAALRASWDTRETLRAGFTSVREVGGQGIYLNKVINEGLIDGPRIYAAGKVIGTTGGHSDIHNTSLSVIDAVIAGDMPILGELADGVSECYKAVRKQIREGAEVIKYCASGGVMSEIDHPIHQQYSIEEQKAIVEEAARAEISVAAHCHGAPGIKSALEAGVKTIEHGTYLDEDLAELMVEKNAILVPTRYVIEKLYEKAAEMGVPDYARIKLENLYDQHAEAVKIAIAKQVPIALGTDMFVSGPGNIFRWGDNAEELKYLHNLGMSLEDCLKAATVMGPQTLGRRQPKSGILKEGYDADVLILKEDPMKNIEIMIDKQNILQVIKQGKKINN